MSERLRKKLAAIPGSWALSRFALHLFRKVVPPAPLIRWEYRSRKGKPLNLREPKTYGEKLQWLKAYWRDPLLVRCGDKYEVRGFVRDRGLDRMLNDLYGVYDRVEQIDYATLPDQFALKCTHGSGYNVICADKTRLDWEQTVGRLRHWMAQNHADRSGEWHYGLMKPRIICEKYLGDATGTPPMDYRFFCFDGEPHLIMADLGRPVERKRNIYDAEWRRLPLKVKYPSASSEFPKPERLAAMLTAARKLSTGFCAVRVDFYTVDGRVYFGEMTFFHGSGFQTFQPEEYDRLLGDLLHLPDQGAPTCPAAPETEPLRR